MFSKKGVFKNIVTFTEKDLYHRLFFKNSLNLIKKQSLVQVFSYQFCEICKNTFFIEHLWCLLLTSKISDNK